MKRLTFAALAGGLAGTLATKSFAAESQPSHTMPPGMEQPPGIQRIVMLVYPKMTALDLIAPQLLFARLNRQ